MRLISFLQVYLVFINQQNIRSFALLFSVLTSVEKRKTLNELDFYTDLFASYAANASSVFLAKIVLPLVREVGIDIMSSAFVVLNLFNLV